jgi:hypothetical protein
MIQMMKTLVLLLLLWPFAAHSQQTKPDPDNPDALPEKELLLKVEKIAPGEIKLPFSNIKVIDNRFDTSKIGFEPVFPLIDPNKKNGKKIVIKECVSKALENYYNSFYQNAFSANNIQLLIVLKKFWLSGLDDEKNQEIDISRNEKFGSFLYCKWEYYLRKGDLFVPVKRVDTVVNGVAFESERNQSWEHKNTRKVLQLILNGLIEVFDFGNAVKQFDELPHKVWSEIQKFNESYYAIPVLTDSVNRKGVYLTFNEFKLNKPSFVNFKERQIRLGGKKYENFLEDENGNRITNYWGYFTGEELKIGKYRNEKLYRKNKTFEFFLQHQHAYISTNIVGGNSYKEKNMWIPCQIDMETGDIY